MEYGDYGLRVCFDYEIVVIHDVFVVYMLLCVIPGLLYVILVYYGVYVIHLLHHVTFSH